MTASPILVIQMHRMGDLILSFPLLAWLKQQYADHPIWVVGEPAFYEPLMPLSPQVTYFSLESTKGFAHINFHLVINLSHREEAAGIAASIKADNHFGFLTDSKGNRSVRGKWHLYRASLTENNRHNLFHWSDLFALDVINEPLRRLTDWPCPRPISNKKGSARIGLFLGASEVEKHPNPTFWAALAGRLLSRGFKPVLLGGTAEKELGQKTASLLKAPAINLCGAFSIQELAYFIKDIDLMVTPDTGPMHIAAWTGTPVLNLSMGSVNPWETGPFGIGHYVYRPLTPCMGCWTCTQPLVICKEAVTASNVARTVEAIFLNATNFPLPADIALLRTARDNFRLFNLIPANGSDDRAYKTTIAKQWTYEQGIARFWQAWFAYQLEIASADFPLKAWSNLLEISPHFAQTLSSASAKFATELSKLMRGKLSQADEKKLWQQSPDFFRAFSGYCHMYLQNENFKGPAFTHILNLLEYTASFC